MSSFTSVLSPAFGSHPTILSIINSSPPSQGCDLHSVLKLPPAIFIDKYDFPLPHVYYGHDDLELPVNALKDSSDSWLLINATNAYVKSNKGRQVEIAIPVHTRYPRPQPGGTYENATMSWPYMFWACPTGKNVYRHGSPDALGPFFENFKGKYIHNIPPLQGPLAEQFLEFNIPVGNLDHLPMVQYGTALAVLCAFLYLGVVISTASVKLFHKKSTRSLQKKE